MEDSPFTECVVLKSDDDDLGNASRVTDIEQELRPYFNVKAWVIISTVL